MFYTKVARVMAAIGFAFGILMFSFGLLMAFAGGGADVEITVRKLTGNFLDYGIYTILASVVMGVLSDISRSLSRIETEG